MTGETRRLVARAGEVISLLFLLSGIAIPFIGYFSLETPGHRFTRTGSSDAIDWHGYAPWYLTTGHEVAAAAFGCLAVAALIQLVGRGRRWGAAGWAFLLGVAIDVVCLPAITPIDHGHRVPLMGQSFGGCRDGSSASERSPRCRCSWPLPFSLLSPWSWSSRPCLGFSPGARERSEALLTWAAIVSLALIPVTATVFGLLADYDPS